jgi:exoribonuclease R
MLSEEQVRRALELAAEGLSIKDIRKEIGVSADELYKFRQVDATFDQKFKIARQEGLEELADSLLDIVDEYQDVQKARVKSENIRFLLSKRKPHVYGDRIDINITERVDIAAALNEAKARLNNSREVKEIDTPAIHVIQSGDKPGDAE